MFDWLARVRPWLNALLILLLLVPLARVAWRLVVPAEPALKPAAQVAQAPVVNAAPRLDLGRLRQAALFGHPAGNLANGELPESTLPLKLQGVIAAGESPGAAAIFESADPALRAARVGMQLQPGVTVKAVYKDRVVINNNGRDERISLKLPPPLPLNSPAVSNGGPPMPPGYDSGARSYTNQSTPGYGGGMSPGQPMNQPPQYPGYNGPQNYPGAPGVPQTHSWQTQ